jgi:hypothetical protein
MLELARIRLFPKVLIELGAWFVSKGVREPRE